MTVPTSHSRVQYDGNDAATEFDYTFKIFDADDLVVVLTDSDDNETTLVRGSDYNVDGVGDEAGGTVTYPISGTPLATGETLTILREIPVVQETDLRNQGRFYPETIEDELDRSRMIDQQVVEVQGRTLKKTLGGDNYDAGGARITNLGDAVDLGDAATRGEMLELIQGVESGEVGDATDVTALGTSDTRTLAVWTRDLGYPNSATGQNNEQTLNEALDQRVISADSFAELPASGIVSGQAASVHGVPFEYDGADWLPSAGFVTPEAYGAVGDGVTDDRDALISAINSGATVVIRKNTLANLLPGDEEVFQSIMESMVIEGEGFVTINLPGSFSFDSRVLVKGQGFNRLVVSGQPTTSLTMVSFDGVVSNGAGDHDVSITYSNASSINVGDYIGIRAMNQIRQGPINGVWEVISKSGDQVTLKNTARIASITAPSTTVGGVHFKFNSVVNFTGNHVGFQVACDWGSTSQLDAGLRNVVLVGPKSGAGSVGVFVEAGCRFNFRFNGGVHGFGSHGIEALYGADIQCQQILASACGENGVYALNNSSIQNVNGASTGNGGYGHAASVGSVIAASGSAISGNNNGFLSDGSSRYVNSGAIIQQNATSAGIAITSASARITSASVTYNGVRGIRADRSSYIDFNASIANNNGGLDVEEVDVLSKINGGTVTSERRNSYPVRVLKAAQANNFGSVPANGQLSFTVNLPGILTSRWTVKVTPNVYTTGVIFQAYPTASDEVTVVVYNLTGSSISVGARTFYLVAFEHE